MHQSHALASCSEARQRGWEVSGRLRAFAFSRQKMLPLCGLSALTPPWTQPGYDQHINALLSTEGADWSLPGLT